MSEIPGVVHVFVDPSGRRGLLLPRLAAGVAALVALLLLLLVTALVAPPGLTRLLVPGFVGALPGAGAPQLQSGPTGVVGSLKTVLASPVASPSPTRVGGGTSTPAPGVTRFPPTSTPGPLPTPTAPTATQAPTVSPTGSPSASPTQGNKPTAPPGQASSAAAPGRPTAKPTHGGRPTATPTP